MMIHQNNKSKMIKRVNAVSTSDASTLQSPVSMEQQFLELESLLYQVKFASDYKKCDEQIPTIQNQIESLKKLVESWRELIPNERDVQKRDTLRKRVEANSNRLNDLSKDFQSFQIKMNKIQIDSLNRARLLGISPGSSEKSHMDAMSMYVKESEGLKEATRGVDDIIKSAGNILTSLTGQTDMLKNTRNRLGNIGQSIGISDSLLKAVRRREIGDKMIVFGGMFLVCLILFLFYKYLHSE